MTQRYREAFPVLNIQECMAAASDARPLCRYFRVSRDRHRQGEFGLLEVVALEDDCLRIRWLLHGPGFHGAGQQTLRYSWRPLRGWMKPIIACPVCGGLKEKLWFSGRWACASCHGLRNRSHRFDKKVRDALKDQDRLLELQRELAEGRPPRMRHSTYQRKLADLKKLYKRLPVRPVANSRLAARTEFEWISEQDITDDQRHILSELRF